MQRGMGPTIQDLVCSVDLQLEIARKLSLEVQKLVAELERRTELAQESRHIQLYLRRSAGDQTQCWRSDRHKASSQGHNRRRGFQYQHARMQRVSCQRHSLA